MKSFDKVIGYDGVKTELMQICDMIKNKELYEKLGAKMPNGILLDGDPGLGKTLMAKCFIEESGLKAFTVRKNKSDGFASHIADIFEEAKKYAPAIVFLDDMDKFANEDDEHPDADEYVTVQTSIDDAKGSGLFVLATVNNIHKLPDSLIRAGRFDRIIKMEHPSVKDSEKIIAHYLRQKGIADHIRIADISKMINRRSCAELETIVNEAAIHAAHSRKSHIDTDDVIHAFLRTLYNCPNDTSRMSSSSEIEYVAIHEAGHVLMCDTLVPESVGLASIIKNHRSSNIQGIVLPCKDIKPEQHILISLAGKAAMETLFGICDDGSEDDLRKAIECIRYGIEHLGTGGVGMMNVTEYVHHTSEAARSRTEAAVQAQLENYMFQVKKTIAANRGFLEKTAQQLIEKETLLNSDIRRIRNSLLTVKTAV